MVLNKSKSREEDEAIIKQQKTKIQDLEAEGTELKKCTTDLENRLQVTNSQSITYY